MAGHLCREHGPFTVWPYVNDAVWLLTLSAVAGMCWWSNIIGRQILSLALLVSLATNGQLLTGILPWIEFHPVPIMISLLAATCIALGGLFIGGRAGRSTASESDSNRTKRALSVGAGVAVCVACFALGYLLTERQRELDEQKYYQARVAIWLHAYRAVATTNWMNARTQFADDLLTETRNYQERFGIEHGTNRTARMLAEALAISDAIEREANSAMLTNAPSAVVEQIDPMTGLPSTPAGREKE